MENRDIQKEPDCENCIHLKETIDTVFHTGVFKGCYEICPNGEKFSPRNPIENKYQKMWEELKTNIKDFQNVVKPLTNIKDDLSSKLLLKSMEEIQEKHK